MMIAVWLVISILFLSAHAERVIPPTLPEFEQANLTRAATTTSIVTAKRTISLINVPDVFQSTSYTCGPSSLKAVLRYFGLSVRQSQIAQKSGTIPFTGTGPVMLETGFKKIVSERGLQKQLLFQNRQMMSVSELQGFIRSGQPVIVLIQNYKPADDPRTYWEYNDGGHYITAVGMDDELYYFEDPATLQSIRYIRKDQFESRWHDYLSSEKRLAVRVGIIVRRADGSKPTENERLVPEAL